MGALAMNEAAPSASGNERVQGFLRALARAGVEVDAADAAQAWTFARVLVRVTRTPRPRGADLPGILDEELRRGCRLDASARDVLFRTLFSLEHAPLDADDQHATMERRFASSPTSVSPDTDGDLDAFAVRGAEERVALGYAAVRVLADRQAPPSAYLGLFDALARIGLDPASTLQVMHVHEPRCREGFRVEFPVPVYELPAAHIDRNAATYSVGSSPFATVCIPDPTVPEKYAEIVRDADGARLTVVDDFGRQLQTEGGAASSMPLEQARAVRIGTWTLHFSPMGVEMRSDRPVGGLQVRDLLRTIPRVGAAPGQPDTVTLLDHISFAAYTGEVIALVGPSGCGKTTLLTALAGIAPPTSGTTRLDGADLAALLERDRSVAGVVPQDDIVHPELTVEESLSFSARLRLGPEVSEGRVQEQVGRVLGELGISHIKDSIIGDALKRGISGGQRKRVNFAQELLTDRTRLLFLDEPTSGLDPIASQSIMRLARTLADRGRTVFVVTHDLSPQIMALVDRLVLLAPGGRLLFFGTPAQACAHYDVATVDAVFGKMTRLDAAANSNAPEGWRREAEARMALLEAQQVPERATPEQESPGVRGAVGWSQFRTLVSRYARVKSQDATGLRVLAAQPPFLAAVMALVFPEPTSQMMFMLSLSCAWFGMSGAVRELISDRVIWRRERRVGIGVVPYVSSKVAVLSMIVTLQCVVLASIAWFTHDLGGHGYGIAPLAGVATLTGLTGMTLGLLVSAIFSSSEAAVGTLPLLLIPQITFSSLLVGLRDMKPLSVWVTWLDPQRYAFEAILRVGKELKQATRAHEWDVVTITTPLYSLGFKGASSADDGLTLAQLCSALVGFCLVFAAATYARVATRKD